MKALKTTKHIIFYMAVLLLSGCSSYGGSTLTANNSVAESDCDDEMIVAKKSSGMIDGY